MAVATTGVRVYGFPVRLLVVEHGLAVICLSLVAAYHEVLRLRCGFCATCVSVLAFGSGWLVGWGGRRFRSDRCCPPPAMFVGWVLVGEWLVESSRALVFKGLS